MASLLKCSYKTNIRHLVNKSRSATVHLEFFSQSFSIMRLGLKPLRKYKHFYWSICYLQNKFLYHIVTGVFSEKNITSKDWKSFNTMTNYQWRREKIRSFFVAFFICTVSHQHVYLEHSGCSAKSLWLSYNHNSMPLMLAQCTIH